MAQSAMDAAAFAIIGRDDTPLAEAWEPGLTSVRLDVTAAGRAIAGALLGRASESAFPMATVIERETV